MARIATIVTALLCLAACAPRLPADRFPDGVEIARTLHAAHPFREGCTAVLVELTEASAARLADPAVLGADWRPTPISQSGARLASLEAMHGCGRTPPAEMGRLSQALERPGGWYRLGSGIAAILPSERLAAYLYYEP